MQQTDSSVCFRAFFLFVGGTCSNVRVTARVRDELFKFMNSYSVAQICFSWISA